MANIRQSFDVPHNEKPLSVTGLFSSPWEWFFRSVFERLYPLGAEQTFNLANNQSEAADIVGMKFNSRGVSQAIIEYCVQRVTTGEDAIEKIESGILIATYNPTSEDWNLHAVDEANPDDAGVTFSILASGQVQYTTTNETGTAAISKIFWRSRTLAGKNSSYSSLGVR